MKHQRIKYAALMAWILAAVSAPLAYLAGRGSLAETVIVGLLSTFLSFMLLLKQDKDVCKKKWYALLQCGFLALVAGTILQMVGKSWPTANGQPMVPMTLLLLAFFGSREGAERASRTAAVLMWLLVLLYAAVLAGGVGNVKVDRFATSGNVSQGYIYLIYLLPGLAVFLPKEKGSGKTLWLIPLIGAVLSALVIGTLSEPVALQHENPLYEFGKSLSLFGVVERFEAFVSVALTIGYYCLLSLLLSTSFHLSENAEPRMGKQGVLLTTVASGLLMYLPVGAAYPLAAAALVVWYILPVIMHKYDA